MKAMNSLQFSPLLARTLKLVGAILILSFFVDFVILLLPFGPRDRTWQIGLTTALVDRGLIPMVGLAFLLTGYWINNSALHAPTKRTAWLDLRLWVLLLSSLLGLLFLVFFPLHINNVRQANAQVIQRINQEASQKETQLQTELGSPQAQAELEGQQNQFRSQVSDLLQNEQRLNQALQSDQLTESQKKLLQRFKADPKALDQFLNQQFGAQSLRDQALRQIRSRREQAEQQAKQETWQSGLRIGITSLLLSIGYIAIGWTGLRSIGALLPGRRNLV
jgi:hypothetical protein